MVGILPGLCFYHHVLAALIDSELSVFRAFLRHVLYVHIINKGRHTDTKGKIPQKEKYLEGRKGQQTNDNHTITLNLTSKH
jgi:hypothetical protein